MSTQTFHGADGGRRIATRHGQDGQSVLLLHGGGQTRHAWLNTAKRLAEQGFTAFSLDQRGHGDSDRARDGAYGFGAFGQDALAVATQIAEQTGVRPVAVGASLGGIASLVALARSPADPCFSALVLVDIVPDMDPRGVAHITGFMMARAKEGFASVAEAADAVATYLPHRPRPRSLDGLRKNLRQGKDGRWRWHWDPAFLDGPHSVHIGYEGVKLEIDAVVDGLPVPTLLVRGASSELVTEAAAMAFLARAKGAVYANIAKARHMVAGDRNDAFGEAVIGFLKGL
jgi:pimeloyl-ACP methyl ester carboxylesterase